MRADSWPELVLALFLNLLPVVLLVGIVVGGFSYLMIQYNRRTKAIEEVAAAIRDKISQP